MYYIVASTRAILALYIMLSRISTIHLSGLHTRNSHLLPRVLHSRPHTAHALHPLPDQPEVLFHVKGQRRLLRGGDPSVAVEFVQVQVDAPCRCRVERGWVCQRGEGRRQLGQWKISTWQQG